MSSAGRVEMRILCLMCLMTQQPALMHSMRKHPAHECTFVASGFLEVVATRLPSAHLPCFEEKVVIRSLRQQASTGRTAWNQRQLTGSDTCWTPRSECPALKADLAGG